jgi:predicted Zn-dependent protease
MRANPIAPKTRRLLLGAIVLVLVASAAIVIARKSGGKNRERMDPHQALVALDAKSLYFNGPARPWLLAQRPDLLTDEDRDEKSDRSRRFVQAVENPKLFRQLDRQYRFDTLLLIGDPSQSRQLLDHLLETRDWTLTYLDHAALIYKRDGAREWKAADFEAVVASFPTSRAQAVSLAQAAVKLLAIRRATDAKALLDRAERLDKTVPDLWSALAVYRMNRGEWKAAMTQVDRALEIDADFLPALATKTQILLSTKKFADAYQFSSRLIAAQPNDPGLLFYHAKICHQAREFSAEIQVLQRLIQRAESEGQPATGYRVYLAQAFAADGQAKPSIEEFKRVLANPEISREQRQFAEDTLAQIKSRSGAD